MNVMILGAAGFIGTNLAKKLSEQTDVDLTLVDRQADYFKSIETLPISANIVLSTFNLETDFDTLLQGQDIVFHLVSSTVPTTSNMKVPEELTANVVVTARLLDACVRARVKRVFFISSGGTVYGKETQCPLSEDIPLKPINSYGIQKATIENLLYLYNCVHGLDYRVVRLSNPYGPYQRPNGVLGAVTTFTYRALCGDEIKLYGDGSVVRDFLYIDDVVPALLKIAFSRGGEKTFNLGSGKGTSIQEVLQTVKQVLNVNLNINCQPARQVDVPINYLDISRYENQFGKLSVRPLSEGICLTADFMREHYDI